MEQKILINELNQGKKLAEQLSYVSSPEERRLVLEKILFSYEKIFSLLNCGVEIENSNKISQIVVDNSALSYDNSSPISDFCDQEWENNSQKNVYKKRKTEPKWSKKVKVCSENGVEGPINKDGYNWRKYGQKDIHKANFPRGYYRCSHRHSQGCLATKQVQRSDQDPTIFEVTYRGRHTCFQTSPKDKPISEDFKDPFDQLEEKPKKIKLKHKNGIKIQELDPLDLEDIFPSFSFPNVEDGNPENNIFIKEHDLLLPVASDYSGGSPCEMYSFGLDYNVSTPLPESDSNWGSVSDSQIGQWDISIDFTDFEASFPLEELELYA